MNRPKPDSQLDVFRIPLERPASIKKQLPELNDNAWIVPDFLVGPENEGLKYLFDEATVPKLAELTPILLYGEKSCGKTALAITLAVRWARRTKSRPLCFLSGRSFAAEYAAALEIDDIDSFRTRVRHSKLLVVDGVDQMASKPAAQEELLHSIDVLAEANAPVIITAPLLPASIQGIPARLVSRLSAGYSLPLFRPSHHTRLALLHELVGTADSPLSADELADFCNSLPRSPKVAELRAIVTAAHQCKTASGRVNFQALAEISDQLLPAHQLSVPAIARVVARRTKIRLADLRGSSREASIVRARGLAILLSRCLTDCSLLQIGQFFGGRDHSTVLHAVRKTSSLLESDLELAKLHQEALAELQR